MKQPSLSFSIVRAALIAFLFIPYLQCASSKAAWTAGIKASESRFQIDVFRFPGIAREKNLELTRRFAAVWKEKSGLDGFVLDHEIIKAILKSGELVPSTNYSINSGIMNLGGKLIMNLTVINKETGEILASARITGYSVDDISENLEDGVDKLVLE